MRFAIAVNQTFVVKEVVAALDDGNFTDAGYAFWAYSAIEAVSDSKIALGYPTGPTTPSSRLPATR
jgi:hypothetical protein